jgi:ATP:ADP antiporter, AAA family
MKNTIHFLKTLDPTVKKNTYYIFISYFLALLSYPFARSSTQTFFYEHYTADNYAMATFYSVVILMAVLFLTNHLQAKWGVHRAFKVISFGTIFTFMISFLCLELGYKPFAYVLFAIKETYIVLIIHIILAFSNAFFSLEQVKRLYGALGAIGSLGGIFGGQLTSLIAQLYNTTMVFYLALICIWLTMIFFIQTKRFDFKTELDQKEETPLASVARVKSYVILIAAIVALTQFVIFIADLQFNVIFEKMVTLKEERTIYLGQIYSMINALTLILQFVLLPYMLMRLKIKTIFYFVPILYLFLILGGLGMGSMTLMAVSFVFITMKATDYSIFSVAKEVMYHPLDTRQKYGAKYITDMFVYRVSKALMAFIMSFFSVKEMVGLNILQSVFISLWIGCVVLLFKVKLKEPQL